MTAFSCIAAGFLISNGAIWASGSQIVMVLGILIGWALPGFAVEALVKFKGRELAVRCLLEKLALLRDCTHSLSEAAGQVEHAERFALDEDHGHGVELRDLRCEIQALGISIQDEPFGWLDSSARSRLLRIQRERPTLC